MNNPSTSTKAHEDQGGGGGQDNERHGQKVTIVINGQQKEIKKKKLSFEEVVALAYDGNPPAGDNWVFTVTFRKAHGNKPDGSLIAGELVKIKEGMIFNVTATDKS